MSQDNIIEHLQAVELEFCLLFHPLYMLHTLLAQLNAYTKSSIEFFNLSTISMTVVMTTLLKSPVMYSDDSVTFDLYFTRTLTFDSSFLYFDPMYENESNLVENNSYCKYNSPVT